MKLLHLDSSIQGSSSASRAISQAVVARLKASDPTLEISYRDLVADPISHLTLDAFAGEQAQSVMNEFLAADVVVIGAALYNFTISSQLKAWIDRIMVAGRTFRYTEAGPEGLAGDKQVIVALARGGIYSDGAPAAAFEHAETLLRGILAFIGVTNPQFIIAEGLALGETARSAALEAAVGQANAVQLDKVAA